MTPDPKELSFTPEKLRKMAKCVYIVLEAENGADDISAALLAFADHLDRERWIPVTERLPEEPGAYLCVIIYRHGRYRAVAIWRGKTWEIDRRVDLNDTVTHWSPLRPPPEPPEEP